MFAIVIVSFILSMFFVGAMLVTVFFNVAFGNLEKSRERMEKIAIKDALARVERVKVNANDPASPTYGDLIQNGIFKPSTSTRRGVS